MPVYIVRSNEVGLCVKNAIKSLNADLWEMNERHGYSLEMPETMKFDMVVVQEWEALESSDKQVAITSEIQGGFQTETQKSSENSTERSDENRKTEDRNSHVNKGRTVTTIEQS